MVTGAVGGPFTIVGSTVMSPSISTATAVWRSTSASTSRAMGMV